MLCSFDEITVVVVAHRGIDHGTSCTLSKNSTSGLTGHHNQQRTIEPHDEVAEWLRRWTANPLGSARVRSNPILVAALRFYGVMVSTLDFESSDPSSNLGRT